MILNNISDTWVRNLAGIVNCDTINEVSLYRIMDKELNTHPPPLKRLIELTTGLSIAPSKSPNEFGVLVKEPFRLSVSRKKVETPQQN